MFAARSFPLVLIAFTFGDASAQPAGFDAFFAPLDIDEPIPVSIVDMTGSTPQAGIDDAELAVWALQNWSRALDGELSFYQVEESAALVRIRFVGPGSGQYGEMSPLNIDGKRGAAVFIRPDTRALGPVIARRAGEDALFREAIVYLTCLHELGHALGLTHTAEYADIMYAFGYGGDIEEYFLRYRRKLSSRIDIATTSGLSRFDVERVRALYSQEMP